jgi:hypothetical protein
LLLSVTPGATSFESLRSHGGTEYATFKQACAARHLLDDDTDWHMTLQTSSEYASANQMRSLFVYILVFGCPQDPGKLWDKFKEHFMDKLPRHVAMFRAGEVPATLQADREQHALQILDTLLDKHDKCLADYPGLPACHLGRDPNRLIREQRDLNTPSANDRVEAGMVAMNSDQRAIFHRVMGAVTAVDNASAAAAAGPGPWTVPPTETAFFIDSPGGCGKTFLLNLLLDKASTPCPPLPWHLFRTLRL